MKFTRETYDGNPAEIAELLRLRVELGQVRLAQPDLGSGDEVEPQSAGATDSVPGVGSPDPLEQFVWDVFNRAPLSPNQLKFLRAVYKTGDAGIAQSELPAAVDLTGEEFRGMIANLGRRINQTENSKELAAQLDLRYPISILFDRTPVGGEQRYRMRPQTRRVLERMKKV